jgi:hypothetical protein
MGSMLDMELPADPQLREIANHRSQWSAAEPGGERCSSPGFGSIAPTRPLPSR